MPAITIETLEGIPEPLKALFTETDGKFSYEPPDVDGLKKKVDDLLTEKKTAAQKAKEAEEAARTATEEAARKSGDVAALEKSWQEKMATEQAKYKSEIDRLSGTVSSLTSGQTAVKLAAEIALDGASDVLMPHISGRLRTEYRDGVPVTVVLDKSGQPSALTVEELKNEFMTNPAFAAIVKGSNASGAGLHGDKGKGGAGAVKMKRADYEQLSPMKKAELGASGKLQLID